MLSLQKVKLSASGCPHCSLLQSLQVNTVAVCLYHYWFLVEAFRLIVHQMCYHSTLTAHLPKRHAHTYVRLSVVYCSRVFPTNLLHAFFVSPYVCLNVFRVVTNLGHFGYDVRLCASMWQQGFT